MGNNGYNFTERVRNVLGAAREECTTSITNTLMSSTFCLVCFSSIY